MHFVLCLDKIHESVSKGSQRTTMKEKGSKIQKDSSVTSRQIQHSEELFDRSDRCSETGTTGTTPSSKASGATSNDSCDTCASAGTTIGDGSPTFCEVSEVSGMWRNSGKRDLKTADPALLSQLFSARSFRCSSEFLTDP